MCGTWIECDAGERVKKLCTEMYHQSCATRNKNEANVSTYITATTGSRSATSGSLQYLSFSVISMVPSSSSAELCSMLRHSEVADLVEVDVRLE